MQDRTLDLTKQLRALAATNIELEAKMSGEQLRLIVLACSIVA